MDISASLLANLFKDILPELQMVRGKVLEGPSARHREGHAFKSSRKAITGIDNQSQKA
jgi:hypothetical protein